MHTLRLLPYYVKLVCYGIVIIAAGIWAGLYFTDTAMNESVIIALKSSIVLGLEVAMMCKEKFEDERNNALRLGSALGALGLLGTISFTQILFNHGPDKQPGVFVIAVAVLFMYHLTFQIAKRVQF